MLRGYAVDAAHRAELVRVATGALEALVGKEINDELGYGGDYQPPDFVQFNYPSAMESAMIVAIDLESNFAFDPPNGDIVTARADVILSIEGNTYKADYFVDGDDDLELVGELNDHYFETSTSVRARAVIEIDIEAGPGRFESTAIVLEDNPKPALSGESSSDELDFNLDPELDPELDLTPGDPGDPSELKRDLPDEPAHWRSAGQQRVPKFIHSPASQLGVPNSDAWHAAVRQPMSLRAPGFVQDRLSD